MEDLVVGDAPVPLGLRGRRPLHPEGGGRVRVDPDVLRGRARDWWWWWWWGTGTHSQTNKPKITQT